MVIELIDLTNIIISDNEIISDSKSMSDDLQFTSSWRTSVRFSCGLTFQNNHYVFGGEESWLRQLSKVKGKRLVRIENLKFDFSGVSCANVDNRLVYLCFHVDKSGLQKTENGKQCRFATSPEGTFSMIDQSSERHAASPIAASSGKN